MASARPGLRPDRKTQPGRSRRKDERTEGNYEIKTLSGGFCGALAILAGFMQVLPRPCRCGARVDWGRVRRWLGPGVAPEGLALASTRVSADGEPAEHRVAVIWSSQSDLRGRLIEVGTGAPATGDLLALPHGVGLAVAFRRGPRSGRRQPAGRACGRDRARSIRRNGSGDRLAGGRRSVERSRRSISSPTGESRWRAPVRPPLRRELGSFA